MDEPTRNRIKGCRRVRTGDLVPHEWNERRGLFARSGRFAPTLLEEEGRSEAMAMIQSGSLNGMKNSRNANYSLSAFSSSAYAQSQKPAVAPSGPLTWRISY